MKHLLFTICFLLQFLSFSQTLKLSVYSEISILTAGPGDELYEAFGHSALRIKDPMLKIDHVFNYGVFDFNQPNYYSNFTKGKLSYFLHVSHFDSFITNYKNNKRWMKAQVLELSQTEKQIIFEFLINNAKPENSSYLYDPFFDNCSTKLRDIVLNTLQDDFILHTEFAKEKSSLRQLMNNEISTNSWGSFGINLALGSKLDKKTTPLEYLYLPDYVYTSFKNSKRKIGERMIPLVKQEINLLDFKEKEIKAAILNPLLIFSIIFFMSLIITYIDLKKGKQNKLFDFLLFLITGLIGILILFLWFFTDHSTTPNNFNILWAFAPNFIIAFVLLKNKKPSLVATYSKVCILLLAILVLIWIVKIQIFSYLIIPILGTLLARYLLLSKLLASK